MQDGSSAFAILDRPYLLVSRIPYFEDQDGRIWLTRLWHHDLVEHLSYLRDFTLCAPRLRERRDPELVRLEIPKGARVRFAPLPAWTTRSRALLSLPRTILTLWSAVGTAHIVHSCVGNPLGWAANAVAKLRGRKLVVVVESPWRRGFDGSRRWSVRLYDVVADAVARWSCTRADVALFTQDSYRETLHRGGRGAAYVTPAVWINEADVVDDASAQRSWARKLSEPVRLLFAGRLEPTKGVDVLLSSLRSLEERGVRAAVDVIGSGRGRSSCVHAAETLRCVRVRLLDPIPYGAAFFDLLQQYHGVLVPSLTDEQPRIVFDANAQAVPVIASATNGLRPYVEHGGTGWLVPPGDGAALAAAIERARERPSELRRMGLASLARARRFTHRQMHGSRSHILKTHLG